MKLSLVIPTCDRPEMVGRAIRSALGQKPPFHSIVVIDDGLNPVAVPDPVLYVRTKGREGLPRARNIGFAAVPDADAVCYLDDDDELLPGYVEEQQRLIGEGYEFGFVKALFRYPGFDTNDPEPDNQGVKRYYDPAAIMVQNLAPPAAWFHTRRAYELTGGWDDQMLKMEDWDFWARMHLALAQLPGKSDRVCCLVHKDHGVSMSQGSPFAYAGCCLWREFVERRLRAMSEKGCKTLAELTAVFPELGAPPQVSVFEAAFSGAQYVSGDPLPLRERVEVYGDPIAKETFALGERNGTRGYVVPASGLTETVNFGMLLCKSKYIVLGGEHALPDIANNQNMMIAGRPDAFVVNRLVCERLGGLVPSLPLPEAMVELWHRTTTHFLHGQH